MKNDDWLGIVIILGIITIGLYGGAKNENGIFSTTNTSGTNKEYEIQQEINKAKQEVDELGKKIENERSVKFDSIHKNLISISYISRSNDPKYEYAIIRNNGTTTIKITGWTLKSDSSGQSIIIPKATYLFFAGIQNSEEDIYLTPNESLYLATGHSPNGASFRLNKCSGYLEQFQDFYPALSQYCPRPKDEDLSSIPKTVNNDACLDYIEYFPTCKIQTESLPANWSYECTNFITTKINYPSCVNTHKNDKDFYQNEWRVYLKRSERLWKDSRENITLYDNEGKIVSTYSY